MDKIVLQIQKIHNKNIYQQINNYFWVEIFFDYTISVTGWMSALVTDWVVASGMG